MSTIFRSTLLLAASTFAFASCSKKDEPTPASTAQSQSVSSLSAASTTSASGQPVAAKHYTFYSLADKKEIAYADSNSTKWDVGFRGTTIIVNGGTSGPGQGGALVYTGLFADLTTAPTTGYAVDGATAKAIPTGSGNGWYTYSSTTNVITPTPGRVLVFRTALGKYAKMEIQNYYKGAPAAPTSADPAGYYTFRYVYQGTGTSFN